MLHEGNWKFLEVFSTLSLFDISPPSPGEMGLAFLSLRVGRNQESGNLQQWKQGKSRSCLCRQHAYWGPSLESLWRGAGCQIQNLESPEVLRSGYG